MKTKKIRCLLGLLFIVSMTGCGRADTFMSAKDSSDTAAGIQTETESGSEIMADTAETCIYVYVCGHVQQPGVYELPADSRICNALESAGGVSEDGDAQALNQAEPITDGQTIYVPGFEEDDNVRQASQDDGLLDINTAGMEELMTLPGIGESKAAAILQYREEHGKFESVEELMDIPGIKEGVFNKIKGSIKAS